MKDISSEACEPMFFLVQCQNSLEGVTRRLHRFIELTDASLPHEIRKRSIGDKNCPALLKKRQKTDVSVYRPLVGAKELDVDDDEETDSVEAWGLGGPVLDKPLGDLCADDGVSKKLKALSRARIRTYDLPGLSVQVGQSERERWSTDVVNDTAVHFPQKRVFVKWICMAHDDRR